MTTDLERGKEITLQNKKTQIVKGPENSIIY